MKVYYSSSLWDKRKGLWGRAQKTNWTFEYGGAMSYVPFIYRFPKGIVFDIITILDEIELRQFFEKYEDIEESLTPLERRCAEQEHPYQDISINKIWLNSNQVENGFSASSFINIPWLRQNEELSFVQRKYSHILRETSAFACKRYCVPYPATNSKIKKILRFFKLDKVNKMKFSTYAVERFLPLDIRFTVSVGEKMKELIFSHPATGIEHTIYCYDREPIELPIGPNGNPNIYIMQLMYEIDPALPQGDTLQFGSSMKFTETQNISEDKYMPTSAASIGIIGGADGPTSFFISTKGKEEAVPCGSHGLPLHTCYSIPSFQKEETSYFFLEGINTKDRDSQEFNFQTCAGDDLI